MLKAPEGTRPVMVTLPLKVQTYDIDFAGHVNNGVYVRWLEDLRMELLRTYYPMEKLIADGIYPVLHSTFITYRRSIGILDQPTARMWCKELGRASVHLEAEISVGETVCAHAVQRAVFLKTHSTLPARIPQVLIDEFKRSLA